MRDPLWLGRATVEDSSALAALESECYSHPWTLGQFQAELSSGPPGAVLVLRSPVPSVAAWRGIGAYCVYRLVVDEMHLLNIAVAPGWRRRGIARWLLGFAIGQAGRAGAVRALLEVREGNVEARALYAEMGFSRLGMRRAYYSEPVENAVVLTLDPLP
ncbi:MAG: ribosomal protein S18-alanine N-acetyltransferase [Acidobacteria bacterium]|nr:ribosomal protein S18-alanine N-acetyltransferase [Acidobacteriota bacterium]